MKRILFIWISLLSCTPFLKSQNLNILLIRDFTRYNTLLIEKNFEEAVKFTNPKLFDYISKEDLLKKLSAAYDMKNMEYHPYLPSIIGFSDPIQQDQGVFIKITFNAAFDIKFLDKDINENNSTSILSDLERKFGKGNVSFHPEKHFFTIQSIKNVIASSYDQQKSWTFITIDNPKAFYILETIVPKEWLY